MLTIHYKAVICTTHAFICTKISNVLQCFQLLGSANITMAHIQRIARLENRSIRRSNTIAKAILELEMPESCKQCKLGHYDELYDITHCDILRECMPYEGRHPDCPLMLIIRKGGLT